MQSRVRSYPTVFQNAMAHKGLAAQKRNATNKKKKPWKKIGWHLLQIFILVPSPRILTQNIYKNSEIFEENAKLHKVISYFYQMYAQI